MLLNVRLDQSDERLVRQLRRKGVKISDVVRSALRTEAELLSRVQKRKPSELVREILAKNRPPPGWRPEKRPPLHDGKAIRQFITAKLKRRRR